AFGGLRDKGDLAVVIEAVHLDVAVGVGLDGADLVAGGKDRLDLVELRGPRHARREQRQAEGEPGQREAHWTDVTLHLSSFQQLQPLVAPPSTAPAAFSSWRRLMPPLVE